MNYCAEVWVEKEEDIYTQVKRAMEPYSSKLLRTGWWVEWMIGGYWSGWKELSHLPTDKTKAMWGKILDQKIDQIQSPGQRHEKASKIFLEFFPDYPGIIPVLRVPYGRTGEVDDIAPVSSVSPDLSCYTLLTPKGIFHQLRWSEVDQKYHETDFGGNVKRMLDLLQIKNGYLVTVTYRD